MESKLDEIINQFGSKKLVNQTQIGLLLDLLTELLLTPNVDNNKKASLFDKYKQDINHIERQLSHEDFKHMKRKYRTGEYNPDTYLRFIMERKISYQTFQRSLQDHINRLFTEFLKGISYFSSDIIHPYTRPIYHREKSCGHRNNLNELDCNGILPTDVEYMRRKNKINLCAIERRIYDNIFKNINPMEMQDTNHIRMFIQTERGYLESCSPGRIIEISVIYNINKQVPLHLEIISSNLEKITMQKFTKTLKRYNDKDYNFDKVANLTNNVHDLYEDDVYCSKTVWIKDSSQQNNSHREDYEKTQNFQNEGLWVLKRRNMNTFGPKTTVFGGRLTTKNKLK